MNVRLDAGADELVAFEGGCEGVDFLVVAHDLAHAAEADITDAATGGQADEVLDGLTDFERDFGVGKEDTARADISSLAGDRDPADTRAGQLHREPKFKPL